MNEQEKLEILSPESNIKDLPTIQKSLDLILKSHAEILQSIYEAKPKLAEGEVYVETLIAKMIFASKTILRLTEGNSFTNLRGDRKLEVVDTPSIYILTRSVIEILLTLEYLFLNDLKAEERLFRYKLWQVSGYMSRQIYVGNLQAKHLEKQKREKEIIDRLKVEIKSSNFYSSLKKNQLWKLDKYGLPRLISWLDLLKQSGLKSRFFENAYKIYTNYAHSEYLSVLQINEGSFDKSASFNVWTSEAALNNLKMINSLTITLVINKFDCANTAYDKLPEEIQIIIEFWEKVAKAEGTATNNEYKT